MPTVYYLCDWSGESGGIKVLYDHVRLLRSIGVNACLGSRQEFERARWFPSDTTATPSVSGVLDHIGPEDALILPEFCMRDLDLREVSCRQLVFVQNMSMITGSPHEERYEGLIVSSRPVARAVRTRFSYTAPIHLVLGMLERELVLAPRHPPRGRIRILIIDRLDKNRGEPECVYARLSKDPSFSVTYVRPRMNRIAFVRLFRDHDVYLHLGHPEGFPVSILEAFGAGCLVIGFAGLGGLQFMQDGENCFVVPDGECEAVLRIVRKLHHWSRDSWARMLCRGRLTAKMYDEDRSRRGLGRLAAFLNVTSSSARLREWTA